MINFLLALSHGVLSEEIPSEFSSLISDLLKIKAVKLKKEVYSLDSKHRAGSIDVAWGGTGFVKTYANKQMKDLLVEAKDTNGALRGDVVIVKRVHTKQGRPKARVVYIAKRKNDYSLVYTKVQHKRVVGVNIKTTLIQEIVATQKSLKKLPSGTVLKIDNKTGALSEVVGVLSDPRVDEKISMELFEKREFFSEKAELEALAHGKIVEKTLYKDRVDLTDLDFCTIDPVDAKDFDDAIYFDTKKRILYVAIADVSEYVFDMGHLDNEAKKRGFSIYFPHKSIPMLPRSLSENLCSLKPNEDRLASVFKIEIDSNNKPIKEELIDAIIHSKKRYTYEEVDSFLDGDLKNAKDIDKAILKSLLPLNELMKKIRKIRLKESFEFHSSDLRMVVDEHQNLVATEPQKETPSHKLVEECMLLANKAAAKKINYGIFRTHGEPSLTKIENLLEDLSFVGIHEKFNNDIPLLIKSIQHKADKLDIRKDVDKLIIKSQQKAVYSSQNSGHFGLGFSSYTHFTSPIRRYSDLVCHRLLKAKIRNDEKREKFLLKNIDPLCESLSTLERQSDKIVWDYMDRKFARWAFERIGADVDAIVVDNSRGLIAKLDDKIKGARIFLVDDNVELFSKIKIKIIESDIATGRIFGKIVGVSDV